MHNDKSKNFDNYVSNFWTLPGTDSLADKHLNLRRESRVQSLAFDFEFYQIRIQVPFICRVLAVIPAPIAVPRRSDVRLMICRKIEAASRIA